ncbi:MAG: hypothetical protein A3H64_02555 [Candidatus Ryanbacteria bacterium RIFCSPLOWO2_02_FULL_45_11c]|uniref:VanZ-like domain-containing protein n=1 Tax=Candidatus Ryanbacteria bacterium RIFCSPLOWO2_02_FULL_45_11c TaxID=1802128 RepID=A0A1G2GX60_9BACT|nr:MAG: hypothetical protein A3H64_02555 [Candidatus Ryanbacteria bacterium RIFCSPLOWO2_02_FULL_45_11c]
MSNSLFNRAAPSALLMLLVISVILGLHIVSIFRGWYVTVPSIDIPLHVLGGAWVALVFFYFQRRHMLIFSTLPFLFSIILVAGVVMLVGVMWEWFEFGFDYIFVPEHAEWRAQLGLIDTMGDLFTDLVGGVLVGLYYLLKR